MITFHPIHPSAQAFTLHSPKSVKQFEPDLAGMFEYVGNKFVRKQKCPLDIHWETGGVHSNDL